MIISIVIPTYNEEGNIQRCLNSIVSQTYPKEMMELIIVDNCSTDKTVTLVRSYAEKRNLTVLYNEIRDPEVSKIVGLREATGDLFMYLDADIELAGNDCLNKISKPLSEDASIVGSFPRFVPKEGDAGIGRFLRYHPLELDPVVQFFCTEIDETMVEDRGEYKICEFHPPRVPPVGICMYRKDVLDKLICNREKFMDIDVPIILSKNGFNRFAYVPSAGIHHTNVRSLSELLRKRKRNLHQIYLPNIDKREFVFFDLNSKRDILKICSWVSCAFLFFPLLIRGIYKTIKYRDVACLYEPIVAALLTNLIIWTLGKSLLRHERITPTHT